MRNRLAEYRLLADDTARMSTIYLVAHVLSSVSDGESNPIMCGRFWSSMLFVLLGVCTYHLIVAPLLPHLDRVKLGIRLGRP
jgi:hypothetical protein